MVSISDIQSGQYYWETEVSHANNIVSADDFIKNELPPNVDVYFQDENYLEFIFEDGKYYSATIFGNGDFTHHQANFEFIK